MRSGRQREPDTQDLLLRAGRGVLGGLEQRKDMT